MNMDNGWVSRLTVGYSVTRRLATLLSMGLNPGCSRPSQCYFRMLVLIFLCSPGTAVRGLEHANRWRTYFYSIATCIPSNLMTLSTLQAYMGYSPILNTTLEAICSSEIWATYSKHL